MPLGSLDQAGLQRLPAVFPALTHLAFLGAGFNDIELVELAVLVSNCCPVLPSPLTAQK